LVSVDRGGLRNGGGNENRRSGSSKGEPRDDDVPKRREDLRPEIDNEPVVHWRISRTKKIKKK